MKFVFFGTPDYVVPILSALNKEFDNGREKALIGVVTQPPQPVGRDKKITYSPVDVFAHTHKIPKFTDVMQAPEADFAVCAAYGSIIPKEVINRYEKGIINIHPSLIPNFRGASPTQAAIVSGLTQTGVTLMRMTEGMDEGPILSSFKSEIFETDTNESLRKRLFEETVPFLLDFIPPFISSKISEKEQDHEKATFTRRIKKEDGFISPKALKLAINGSTDSSPMAINFVQKLMIDPSPHNLDRFIRAVTPWPGAWTNFLKSQDEGKVLRLIIHSAHIEDGKLVPSVVQVEGKSPVSWEQFKQGYPQFIFPE